MFLKRRLVELFFLCNQIPEGMSMENVSLNLISVSASFTNTFRSGATNTRLNKYKIIYEKKLIWMAKSHSSKIIDLMKIRL